MQTISSPEDTIPVKRLLRLRARAALCDVCRRIRARLRTRVHGRIRISGALSGSGRAEKEPILTLSLDRELAPTVGALLLVGLCAVRRLRGR